MADRRTGVLLRGGDGIAPTEVAVAAFAVVDGAGSPGPDDHQAASPVTTYAMPAGEAAALLRALTTHDVSACVGGGWGVDALLGEQTRDHSDLDLWVDARALESLSAALGEQGIDRILPYPGDRPWNFVLHDGRSRRVDLHLYETLSDGQLHYGSVIEPFVLPASALSYRGVIDGLTVDCEDPEWAVRFHTGYLPRPSDRHDIALLCARFDIAPPDVYA